MSPITVKTPAAVQIIVAAEYWARSFGAFPKVPVPVEVIVTAPPEIVVSPTPID